MSGTLSIDQDQFFQDIAERLYQRRSITSSELVAHEFVDHSQSQLIEQLAFLFQTTNADLRSFLLDLFPVTSDMTQFLKYVCSESCYSSRKLVPSRLYKEFCIGEISLPRLSILSCLSPSGRYLLTLEGIMENDCEIMSIAPETFLSAAISFVSYCPDGDVLRGYLESFYAETMQRLPNWIFIWSQAKTDLVDATVKLAGSDAFEICEAAMSIDGLTDFPAHELHGIHDFMHFISESRIFSMSSVLDFLRRIFEKASEASEYDRHSIPTVVMLDLNQYINPLMRSGILKTEASMQFSCIDLIPVPSVPCNVSCRAFAVRMSPAKWMIETIPGIVGRLDAKIIVSQFSSGIEIWSIDFLRSEKSQILPTTNNKDVFEFSVSTTVETDEAIVSTEVLLNGTLPISVTWENPQRNTTVPVLDISGVSENPTFTSQAVSPIGEKNSLVLGFPDNLTVQALPTEIQLPAQYSFMGVVSIATIPMLPNPRVAIALVTTATSEERRRNAQNLFQSDLVAFMNVSTSLERDILREARLADIILLDESVFDSHPLIAGITIGASTQSTTIHVMSLKSSLTPQLQRLVDQHILIHMRV
jgi:hypothetical protein